MEMKCNLTQKEFTTDNGEKRNYYVLRFTLIDGSPLEIPIKGDKAKLLLITGSIEQSRNK